MAYSVDEIYKLVGRDNRIGHLTLDPELYPKFGKNISVKFVFNQFERQELENNYNNRIDKGYPALLQVKYVDTNSLTEEQIKTLESEGIHSAYINDIGYFRFPTTNPYYSNENRTFNSLVIPFKIQPKGRDFNWIYGFTKQRLEEGIGLPPDDMNSYYAWKLYFEPEQITPEERLIMYDVDGELNLKIEMELINLRMEREETTDADLNRYMELYQKTGIIEEVWKLIKEEFKNANTDIKKVGKENLRFLLNLFIETAQFKQIHLNLMGAKPIYLDRKGFLHVFIRHVKEYRVSDKYDKDYFQWDKKDVIKVISNVITNLDNEIQAFWVKNPGKRFSRWGRQSLLYEGDYYVIQIEGNGRLDTFHKSTR